MSAAAAPESRGDVPESRSGGPFKFSALTVAIGRPRRSTTARLRSIPGRDVARARPPEIHYGELINNASTPIGFGLGEPLRRPLVTFLRTELRAYCPR